MIRVECPKCEKTNPISDDEAGQAVACSHCGRTLRVPELEDPADEAEDSPRPAPERKSKAGRGGGGEEGRPRGDEGTSPRKKGKASNLLGPRERAFGPRKELLRTLVFVFGAVGAGGVVCFILALVGNMMDSGVAIAIFMIPTGVVGCLWCLNFLTLKVVLHEGGIVHSHNGRRRIIPWEDIASIKQAINEVYHGDAHVATTYKYTLELQDKTKIVYTNYRVQKVEKLAEVIIEKTSDVLLPQARRDYDRGEVVEFGRLGVSEDGLHYGDSLLKWRDIKGVQIKAGYISVRKRGKWLKWCNIAASSVPNLVVFLSMVNEIVGLEDD